MNEHLDQIRPVLELYGEITGLGAPELDDAIVSDLIADLRHWCDKYGWNFAQLESRALSHYLAESTNDQHRTAD